MMMTAPIRFKVISRRVVDDLTRNNSVPKEFLDNYLASRPKILDDGFCDIFQRNCRSESQRFSAFELFEQAETEADADVIVFPFWLELFEAAGCRENIQTCIDYLKNGWCRHQPIVIQWNHDRDAATVPELQNLPSNFFVLQFNTSKPTKNDILLPFWAVNTDPPGWDIKPTYLAGFTGFGGTDIRRKVRSLIQGRPEFYWSEDRINEHEYFLAMSRCEYSLCPRGGGLSSYRVSESFHAERPPILIGDNHARPFQDDIATEWWWREAAVSFSEDDFAAFSAVSFSAYLKSLDWEKRVERCRQLRPLFSLWGVHQQIHKRLMEFLK